VSKPRYYRLIGRLAVPCNDLDQWARSQREPARRVGWDRVGVYEISTAFVGFDIAPWSTQDGPHLFETIMFGSSLPMSWQSASWAEAEIHHLAAVAVATQLTAQRRASEDRGDAGYSSRSGAARA
jgi:hypothetical protein